MYNNNIPKKNTTTSKEVCYCDLDGVFAPYPECWLDFIEVQTQHHFNSLDEAKKRLSYADYISLKNNYRSSDFKYTLAPRKDSSYFTKFLKQRGYSLVIATIRPISHPKLMIRTIRWLDKSEILFDDILFCNSEFDVVTKYPTLSFCVEDEPNVANIMAGWGYQVFLMRSNYHDIANLHKSVVVVEGFRDIMEILKECDK